MRPITNRKHSPIGSGLAILLTLALPVCVALTGCGQEQERNICAQASLLLAQCTDTAPLLVDSCTTEERLEAENILALGCDAFDPGKADFADFFKCSFLGKRAGACVRLAEELEKLLSMGQSQTSLLPDSPFEVLVWNCYKGQKDGWDADVQELTGEVEIAVFQEFLLDPDSTSTFQSMSQFLWQFAVSFFNHVDESGVESGVTTGSVIQPTRVEYRTSPVQEPVANTPKMSMYTWYAIPNSNQELLVVNVHAINYRLSGAFERHMLQVDEVIGSHQGPVIAGGDFNTWIFIRQSYLDGMMANRGLTRVELDYDIRETKLDHVYVRGVNVESAKLLAGVESSDHKPILLTVSID